MSRQVDYLIVGQGIAGTVFAWRALQAGHSVHVVDPGPEGGSSWVAGGLYGPVSGAKSALQWRVLEFLAEAESLYRRIEDELGERFLHSARTLNAFRSTEARTAFEKRRDDLQTAGVRIGTIAPHGFPSPFRSEEGGYELEQTGWLDLRAFLMCSRTRWSKQGILTSAEVIPGEIGRSRWRDLGFREGILCSGQALSRLPELAEIPWGRTRGELLEIRVRGFQETRILKRKMALIPQPIREVYRWVATYENRPAGEGPTETGQTELLSQLTEALGAHPVEILSQTAGIRTHVRDHFPVIGRIRGASPLSLMGAFGSKGVLWAPLCAGWLLDHLEQGTEIPARVDLARYF